MTKNYEYIEQLLDSYFECQTTLEEEQILRAFFAQENVPVQLLPYRKLFTEPVFAKNAESLGGDFDERIMNLIGIEDTLPLQSLQLLEKDSSLARAGERLHVKARVVSMHKRLRPLYKAAACVAVVLALGQAAQMPYYQSEAEQQQSLARSLEQLQQIQKDKNAVAKSDSIKKAVQNIDALQN